MLTDAQKVDVRRYAGYPLGGDQATQFFAAPVFASSTGQGQITSMTLDFRLDHLTTQEEAVLVNVYLTNLNKLELAVLDAQDGIDTTSAGTWTANPKEIDDRERLYNNWRRKMCAFIGLQPGPGLPTPGMTITRG